VRGHKDEPTSNHAALSLRRWKRAATFLLVVDGAIGGLAFKTSRCTSCSKRRIDDRSLYGVVDIRAVEHWLDDVLCLSTRTVSV